MKTKNLDIYGSEPIPWGRARDADTLERLDAVYREGGWPAARWPISQ